MADIEEFGGIISNGDIIKEGWLNGVTEEINNLKVNLLSLGTQIANTQDLLVPFHMSIMDGITVAIAGGIIKLESGHTKVVEGIREEFGGSDGDYYVYVNQFGNITSSFTRPEIGYEIGLVTIGNGTISKIDQYPTASIRAIDLGENSHPWIDIASAWVVESDGHEIPSLGEYHIVPFDAHDGGGFSGDSAIFTAPSDGNYIFQMQIRVTEKDYVDNPDSTKDEDLSGKVSVFVTKKGGTTGEELGTALSQAQSARGDLVLNASNARPVSLEKGDKAEFKVYITEGVDPYIRKNSAVQIWKIS